MILTSTHNANLLRDAIGFGYVGVIDPMDQAPDLISQVSWDARTNKQSAECFRSHTFKHANVSHLYILLCTTIDKVSFKGGWASQHVVSDLLSDFEALVTVSLSVLII